MNKIPFIEKGQHGVINFHSQGKRRPIKLFTISLFLVLIFFLILLGKLFQLTIVKGVYYRDLADQNRIREIIVEAPRGTLVDRKGISIASNIAADTSQNLPRIFSKRTYTQPAEAWAHLVGYRQIADARDLKNDSCLNKLKNNDKVGKKGVEKYFECDLRGVAGKKLVEIDARGKYMRTLSVIQPQAGKKVHLAVDSLIQQKAYELIKDTKAVVVGLKPQTGEILTLTSSPSFDPQAFENGDADVTNSYITDTDKPLFNRATEGVYPPGSTFKLVLAAGALEDKKVTADTIVEDKGFIKAGQATFNNWFYLQYGKTDGDVNMVKAIQRSNDVYFYTIGAKMGPENIQKWAEELGYHSKTDIGIEEAEGTIPSPFWKEDVLKEQWYLGDTYNLSIGQGYVTATPLQVALSTAIFANGGYLCKPHLQKLPMGSKTSELCHKLPMSQKTIDTVREGMRLACASGGTGYPFFEFKVKDSHVTVTPTPTQGDEASPSASIVTTQGYKTIRVGCKTGTAESNENSIHSHAWFTVFAPYDNPEIVLTVLVEEGGQGSDIAAPIAKEVLQTYFERNQ